jgi:hypothetical protein
VPLPLVEKKFKNKTTNINTIIDCTLTKIFPKGQWDKDPYPIVEEVTVLK